MTWSNIIFNILTPSGFVYTSIGALLLCALLEWRKIRSLASNEIVHAPMRVLEIANMIKEGSMAYLLRQFKVLIVVETMIALGLFALINIHVAVAFSIGALLSWLCGFISMYVSVSANFRVTLLAKLGIKHAFKGAFSVGKLVGFLVTGVALGAVYMAYQYSQYFGKDTLVQILIGLSFGASLISVFARVGGGIFTKGADIGADLVGKIEQNIPEDDARNPAVIADNVGDNVGDCAGMAADLFESFIVIVSAAIALATCLLPTDIVDTYIMVAFVILASGAFASIVVLVSGWSVKENAKFASQGIALKTLFFTSIIMLNALGYFFWGMENIFQISICTMIGIFSAIFVMPLTEYYTSSNFRPVKSIVEASEQGHATNIIQGLAVGLEACFVPFLIIGASILICMFFLGILGVAIACVGMISVCAVILALDAFGPVTDNAGGIAEMSGLDAKIRVVTDELDAMGNITKATTKGYAVYSAALATLVLATTYKMDLMKVFSESQWIMDIGSGNVVAGFFVGAALVALFAAITLLAVNKASRAIIEEVRHQFRTMPGIMRGTQTPMYARAVDILTKASLRAMILPSLLPIVGVTAFFMLNKMFFGIESAFIALGGLVMGATIVGILIACSMTISGGAWDNAKKAIESAGKKGSSAHQAAVTGDTIGDPYKDTAGPSINPMIKLIGITALLLIMVHLK